MGAKPKNSIKMYTFLSGFALLFLLFVGHGFADCTVEDCTDMDTDKYTPNTTCNTDDTCPSCICGDCNDTNSQTYPGATEICDGQDNDCNDIIDDEELDLDNDGFMICNGDCNDTNPNTYFGATEICDGQDNDCNDIIDDEELDLDNDGFMICNGDCNDTNPDTYPDAPEICDGQDNDCDGSIDENFPELGDECGTGACEGVYVCNEAGTGTECNGPSPTIEICSNNIDDDCDGAADCEDPECIGDPYCTGIPEFPSILAPILIVLSTTLLRLKHAF